MYVNGSDFKFYILRDGIPIAICHSTDCVIETSTEELETTGPNNGRWASYIPGINSYTISAPGLTVYQDDMNVIDLRDFQDAGTIIEWRAGIDPTGGLQYRGYMFITSLSESSPAAEILRYEMSARGTGPLQVVKNPLVRTVYLSDIYGVRLAGCPNPYPVTVLWYDGSVIGLANNPDEVVTQFNEYPFNQYYQLSSPDNSCNFTMTIAWNAPETPEWVPAEQGGLTGLWVGAGDGGISPTDDGNELLTPFEVGP
ncbi:phage tail tube protein [Chitinophaga pinensis]|uniref:Uncharacterized protein n=1 Tax=Chitinophaga pinensis (strain ATCC 43595 / DSM 2588 / LMG 13176 / NBRC 15968 / NCIMB 11800 / UQM 2034) TaxID=485918 RepID=A0A979G5S6_CHIPD|nr:phage tail tube protein [Chitinophaga pinensis]ACU61364.1 hypothetical protein Cpin_3902 [Chitinophaga pinensis DSM 2588]